MFRELEPKIQKKYLDTVSDSYEILTLLAEKAATAAMAVSREKENGRVVESGQR